MDGERVVFVEETGPPQSLKLIAGGNIDALAREALEDCIKPLGGADAQPGSNSQGWRRGGMERGARCPDALGQAHLYDPNF